MKWLADKFEVQTGNGEKCRERINNKTNWYSRVVLVVVGLSDLTVVIDALDERTAVELLLIIKQCGDGIERRSARYWRNYSPHSLEIEPRVARGTQIELFNINTGLGME